MTPNGGVSVVSKIEGYLLEVGKEFIYSCKVIRVL